MASSAAGGARLRHLNLLSEYREVANNAPLDTYILPDPHEMYLFHGLIQPGQGVWKGIVFKFLIKLPADSASSSSMAGAPVEHTKWPQVTFVNAPPHPLIAKKTGALNIEHLFEIGNGRSAPPKRNLLGFVVKIKSLLFPEPELLSQIVDEKAWNSEALERFRNDGIEYFEEVRDRIKCMSRDVAPTETFADIGVKPELTPFSVCSPSRETVTMMNFLTSTNEPKSINDLVNFVSQSVQEREKKYGGNHRDSAS
eukprot:gb/GECG01016386.1/.p1 GENE.gb/GECG01016386.1/~~gb/GECG01016386.1/.p1  ORF type:complete len:254 (+),score=26.88 gb/GECG01016386.1/:1-762(+)